MRIVYCCNGIASSDAVANAIRVADIQCARDSLHIIGGCKQTWSYLHNLSEQAIFIVWRNNGSKMECERVRRHNEKLGYLSLLSKVDV